MSNSTVLEVQCNTWDRVHMDLDNTIDFSYRIMLENLIESKLIPLNKMVCKWLRKILTLGKFTAKWEL